MTMESGGDLNSIYSLGRKLGEGQFGTTFLCVKKNTANLDQKKKKITTKYACKSILKSKLETEKDVEDVKREIQIMQHLSKPGNRHKNIIAIKGFYEDEEAVHIVMELCEGGELFDRLQKGGRYKEEKAAKLARVIIDVLRTCHSLGVMHRDVKPENFMFVNQKEDSPIKMIDFGLSVFFKPGEKFDETVGSPYYVAPEVLRGEHYGPEADVWSVGVVIYILLTGVPPFWAETEEGIFKQVLEGELDFISEPWPSISESAKDLLRKMLERDPERRATAGQILFHPWLNQGRNKRKRSM